ncbi:helix-turn-helix domain-containing protein [Marinilabilia salmonicolor]|jgi:ribosome-binding protein aMBF1 (putative translation factor)|uniref:Helix-turn-helix protein n=1 Tax=Marinilabilia salmonicolor TaxID=989 RepID=A0A368UTK7_9BACT|nr:helix-turn-helix transcriptional regulator [Marinilabilia salmonicolor]RCW31370.1 helix-turn-helix protein [Marinilabilia salmonicolor]
MSNQNIENFRKLISDDRSGWMEKARQRKENRVWTKRSFQIAVLILREIRRQKPINGMTQKMLAEKLNVSAQYINKVVKGKENLTLETIAKIEEVLGITLMEIPTEESSVNVPYEASASADTVDKRKAVNVNCRIIELKSDYTKPTGTNG